jgi:rhamnopyranosyl-N-acetylglucosaminyl-diphospho-decaprenol beta-1,3/1,4-galactofuranosyltransferase
VTIQSNTYKVIVVLVTNNRLLLLKEAFAGVKAQLYPLFEIIVVNNASTDGTGEWLDMQEGITVVHQENTGGSGGFYTGIKLAVQHQADWIWVMDDDTICRSDSLQKLVDKLQYINEPVGFIGSKCIWTDDSPHLMNIPAIKPVFNKHIQFNKYDSRGLLLVETSSFVSLMINAESIRRVGLPYREFFIWGDDQEYTRRITKAGFLGFYCLDSIVLHKTPINYFPDFYRDTVPNLWKHRYGFRNEFFMVKKNKGLLYFICWLPVKILYTSFKLITIRTNDRLKFISVLWGAAFRSIFFNPKADMI